MALPIIAAGVAARVVAKKVATNAAKKAATKAAQKSKTNQIAKNSVKVKKAMDPKTSSKFQKLVNEKSTKEVLANKSGSNAKNAGKYQERVNSEVNKIFGKDKPVKINATAKNSKTATKSTYKTPSLAKTQAKGIVKLAGAGVATGAFTQVPAVKQSIKRQVEQANKNKKRK